MHGHPILSDILVTQLLVFFGRSLWSSSSTSKANFYPLRVDVKQIDRSNSHGLIWGWHVCVVRGAVQKWHNSGLTKVILTKWRHTSFTPIIKCISFIEYVIFGQPLSSVKRRIKWDFCGKSFHHSRQPATNLSGPNICCCAWENQTHFRRTKKAPFCGGGNIGPSPFCAMSFTRPLCPLLGSLGCVITFLLLGIPL